MQDKKIIFYSFLLFSIILILLPTAIAGVNDWDLEVRVVDDGMVVKDGPDTNYNNWANGVGVYGSAISTWRGLFMFNISSIPVNSTIDAVSFDIYNTGNCVGQARNDINIHRHTDITWREESVTWNNQPAFNNTVIDTENNIDATVAGWYNYTDAKIEEAVSLQISSGNMSFLVKHQTEDHATVNYVCFQSKEQDATVRAVLRINYTSVANIYLLTVYFSGINSLLVNSTIIANNTNTAFNISDIANITATLLTNYNFFRFENLVANNHTHYSYYFLLMDKNKTVYAYALSDISGNGGISVIPNNQNYLGFILLGVILSSIIAVGVGYAFSQKT